MKQNYSDQIQVNNNKTTFNNFEILERKKYLLESKNFLEISNSKSTDLISEINKNKNFVYDEYPSYTETFIEIRLIDVISDFSINTREQLNSLLETYNISNKYIEYKKNKTLIGELLNQPTNQYISDSDLLKLAAEIRKINDKCLLLEREIEEIILNKMLFLVDNTRKPNKKETYDLSLYPNMFMELGKVNPAVFSDIIKFSNHFGNFYERHTLVPHEEDRKFNTPTSANDLFFVSLDLIKYQIVFQEFINVLNDPTEENFQKVIDLFNEFSEYKPSLRIENKQVTSGIRIGNLFKLAFFQMYIALIENIEFRKCDYCQSYFQLAHKRQRFCPPLPLRKRSSCEMAHHREIKKQKKEGDS